MLIVDSLYLLLLRLFFVTKVLGAAWTCSKRFTTRTDAWWTDSHHMLAIVLCKPSKFSMALGCLTLAHFQTQLVLPNYTWIVSIRVSDKFCKGACGIKQGNDYKNSKT